MSHAKQTRVRMVLGVIPVLVTRTRGMSSIVGLYEWSRWRLASWEDLHDVTTRLKDLDE